MQEILDKMIQAGVIMKATSNVLLVSNLMTRKKKSGDLRILIDSRIANAAVKRMIDIGNAGLIQQMTQLKQSILLTSTDLSDAFYQIGITPFLSSLLSFLGPDRQLYSMAKAGQGYINSAGALNLAVSRMKSIPVLDLDFSGHTDVSLLPKRPIQHNEWKEVTQPSRQMIFGTLMQNANTTEDLIYIRPPYAHEALEKSNVVTKADNCQILSYVDDCIVGTPHFTTERQRRHKQTFTKDIDDLTMQDDIPLEG